MNNLKNVESSYKLAFKPSSNTIQEYQNNDIQSDLNKVLKELAETVEQLKIIYLYIGF